jgi:hypothetical protein
MTTYGYLPYLIRITPPSRPRNLQRLSDVGRANTDFLAELRSEIATLGNGYHSFAQKAEGFRVNDESAHGRSTILKIRRGPEGIAGESYDMDSGESVEAGDRTALLSELRAGFYIPEDSYFGFMFVERIGGRHLKDLIYKELLTPIAKRMSMLVRIDAFAESDDWRAELSGQKVMRVTEILRPKDSAADASTVDDTLVKVSAEGSRVQNLGEQIKDMVLDVVDRKNEEYRSLARIAPLEDRRRVWGQTHKRTGEVIEEYKEAPKSIFTVADKAELEELVAEIDRLKVGAPANEVRAELQGVVPINRDSLESQTLAVEFGQERPEKLFVVESQGVPQLVYPLGERLVDILLQRTWEAHAEKVLTNLGVAFPDNWLLQTTP